MSDASKPFNFADFVPGFDFLKNLATGSAASTASAVPGLPGLASWVAPTLSVEEVDKRIQELKTVQFWLDQNLNALKATIQALEVQKMTLSTLKGMNVRMEDLANSFTRAATVASAAPTPPAPKPATPHMTPVPAEAPEAQEAVVAAEPKAKAGTSSAPTSAPASASSGGVVDPLQWWGALTKQFEEIAGSALRDAASLKVPSMLQSPAKAAARSATRKTVAAPAAARKAAKPAAKKKPASSRR